jgi:hypothetical protein
MGLDIRCNGESICYRYSGYQEYILFWHKGVRQYLRNNMKRMREDIRKSVKELVEKMEDYKKFRDNYIDNYVEYVDIFMMFRLNGYHIMMTHSGTEDLISSNDARQILITYSIIKEEFDRVNEYDDGEYYFGTEYTDNFLALCYISVCSNEPLIYS